MTKAAATTANVVTQSFAPNVDKGHLDIGTLGQCPNVRISLVNIGTLGHWDIGTASLSLKCLIIIILFVIITSIVTFIPAMKVDEGHRWMNCLFIIIFTHGPAIINANLKGTRFPPNFWFQNKSHQKRRLHLALDQLSSL